MLWEQTTPKSQLFTAAKVFLFVCFCFLGFRVLPWTTCLLRGKLCLYSVLFSLLDPCCWGILCMEYCHCGQGRRSVENHGLALKVLISKWSTSLLPTNVAPEFNRVGSGLSERREKGENSGRIKELSISKHYSARKNRKHVLLEGHAKRVQNMDQLFCGDVKDTIMGTMKLSFSWK